MNFSRMCHWNTTASRRLSKPGETRAFRCDYRHHRHRRRHQLHFLHVLSC